MAQNSNRFTVLVVFILLVCFVRPAFSSFTKLSSSGDTLSDISRTWAMVKDNTTGLVWEIKNASDGTTNYDNPQDPDNTYTWYDSDSRTNGGESGINGDKTDTEDFINAINRAQFGGFTDWRMPTKDELLTIVDLTSDLPKVDTTYFKNTNPSYYWTATTLSESASSESNSRAWKVNFRDGSVTYHSKYDADYGQFYVRAVRSDSQPSQDPGIVQFRSSTYNVNEADTVTVSVTRTGGSYGSAYVNYAVKAAGTTATQDSDFTLSSGTLIWADGDTTDKTFDIRTNDDTLVERDEYVVLYLSSPVTTAGATIGNPSETTITITDNDTIIQRPGVLQFEREIYLAGESSGKVIVTVTRTDGSSGALSVDYSLKSDDTTATLGSDFTLPAGTHTLSWGDGDNTPKTIEVSLVDDVAVEEDESLVLEINSQQAGILGISYITKITISDTKDRTDNLIDIIDNPEGITPEQTVTVIKDIEEIIDDPDSNFEDITTILEPAEQLVIKAIEQGATPEQMRDIADNTNNILNKMGNIIKAAVITDDVVLLLTPKDSDGKDAGGIKGVTGGGILAALAGKGSTTPAKIIDSLGETVANGLKNATDGGVATDAGVVSNTGIIIESAAEVVNHAINTLVDNTQDGTIIKETLDQFQVELKKMISQTTENIKNKPLSATVTKTANRLTDTKDDSPSRDDFKVLMENVSGLTTSMIKNEAILKSDLFDTMRGLSSDIMRNIVPAFNKGAKAGERESESESDINKFQKDYPQLLNEFIKIASVNLTSGMVMTPEEIKGILKKNSSFNATEIDCIANGLPDVPDFNQDIIQTASTEFSLVELIAEQLKPNPTDPPVFTVGVRASKGIEIMIILKETSSGAEIPFYIQDARIVSSIIPDGIYGLPEGSFLFVSKGIAGIITPAPKHSMDILLYVCSLFDAAEKVDTKIDKSGNLKIKFKDRRIISGSFGYGTVRKSGKQRENEGDGYFAAGTTTFEVHGTDPATEAYSILVVYEDGSTQQLSPSISALEQLVEVLDLLPAGSYTIDRATGILTIFETMRLKPSYFLEASTTANDKKWFYEENEKSGIGIVFEYSDYNGDGAVDLKMWTSEIEQVGGESVDVIYKQVIYTVIQ